MNEKVSSVDNLNYWTMLFYFDNCKFYYYFPKKGFVLKLLFQCTDQDI